MLRTFVAVVSLVGFAAAQTTPLPKSFTLDQAITEAIDNNLDLAAQKLNIPVAQAREITARLRPNPVLSVSGQTLNLLGANYSTSTPLGPNQLNIHTDFPIERGHKREQRIALAHEDISLAEIQVREAMRQLIGGVQSAFVDVQQASENLMLAQDNLKRLENVVEINTARLKAGDLAQVELDRSKVAALQYRTAVQQAQLQLDQAKINLQQVMGRKEKSTDIEVLGPLRREDVATTLDELKQQALARRPDIKTEQQSQARSQADLKLQLANSKFDFNVGTEFTRQSAYGVAGNSVGLYFSMPLQFFNRNQGEIARARREIELAQARINARQSSVATEVEQAWRQYNVSRQLLTGVETDILARARSVRDTTEYSYKRGEASLVEFLDAQRAFNDAMQSFNDARVNYARSLYLLDTVSAATVSGLDTRSNTK
jgi:outer membrane protein, heavy metal efflux system